MLKQKALIGSDARRSLAAENERRCLVSPFEFVQQRFHRNNKTDNAGGGASFSHEGCSLVHEEQNPAVSAGLTTCRPNCRGTVCVLQGLPAPECPPWSVSLAYCRPRPQPLWFFVLALELAFLDQIFCIKKGTTGLKRGAGSAPQAPAQSTVLRDFYMSFLGEVLSAILRVTTGRNRRTERSRHTHVLMTHSLSVSRSTPQIKIILQTHLLLPQELSRSRDDTTS